MRKIKLSVIHLYNCMNKLHILTFVDYITIDDKKIPQTTVKKNKRIKISRCTNISEIEWIFTIIVV